MSLIHIIQKTIIMKILGIFKKENKKTVVTTAQKLDKNQLEKVIGGNGGLTLDETSSRFKKQIETTENES